MSPARPLRSHSKRSLRIRNELPRLHRSSACPHLFRFIFSRQNKSTSRPFSSHPIHHPHKITWPRPCNFPPYPSIPQNHMAWAMCVLPIRPSIQRSILQITRSEPCYPPLLKIHNARALHFLSSRRICLHEDIDFLSRKMMSCFLSGG